eukprot:TRINITY_DN66097_c0_g1_i1.p1 TRINITY_DN66097_c0_g1~~TRINITY_DN66097_c0_g1_i1.p1  ORF type:complete len:339 (+),score=86.63 TRINITY_DN66097_c0_g1_i1:67-1083(+)
MEQPAGAAGKTIEAVGDASPETFVEFPTGLDGSLPLFVQSSWRLSEGIVQAAGQADICHIVAFDGLRCWEGALCRKDLDGPLGESWSDPSNLRLLRSALAMPPETQRSANATEGTSGAAPTAEALWSVGAAEHGAGDLELSVHFIYREGPVAAIRGAKFKSAPLGPALARLCEATRSLQDEAAACKAAAEEEQASLRRREGLLKKKLDELPAKVEAEEARLLGDLAGMLNNQKRRCRRLWLESADADQAGTAAAARPMQAATMSLEQCLEREELADIEPEPELQDAAAAGTSPVVSLTFGESLARPMIPEAAEHGAGTTTFSIPLTLGMTGCTGARPR